MKQDAGAGGGGGGLDREAFLELWPRLRVLARCSPSDKYLLVMAIKQLRAEGRLQEVRACGRARERARDAPLPHPTPPAPLSPCPYGHWL